MSRAADGSLQVGSQAFPQVELRLSIILVLLLSFASLWSFPLFHFLFIARILEEAKARWHPVKTLRRARRTCESTQ